jgi:hypothetical protein
VGRVGRRRRRGDKYNLVYIHVHTYTPDHPPTLISIHPSIHIYIDTDTDTDTERQTSLPPSHRLGVSALEDGAELEGHGLLLLGEEDLAQRLPQ